MTDLTQAQAIAFIDALEAENNSASRPCPDLAAWIADCRAAPSTLAWEAERWPTYDGDEWEPASLVEYANGQLTVVVAGNKSRGVVMTADDRFHPVTGNPSGEWSMSLSDDHAGFTDLAEAIVAAEMHWGR